MSKGSRMARAVALEYGGRRAPVVTAKGDAELAERILEAARRTRRAACRSPHAAAVAAVAPGGLVVAAAVE